MEGIIRQYLESQTRIDECFKEKYKPELFDRCFKYIWKLAKEEANKFEDIPDEMLDYIPENMDTDADEDGTLPWNFDEAETPAEKLFI